MPKELCWKRNAQGTALCLFTDTFVPWRHLAHILSELTKRLPNQLTDRAWKVVNESLDH
jgi:hypothetical protein